MEWMVYVHAGAWDIPRPEQRRHVRAVHRAVLHAGGLLQEGKSALDAAVAAVALLEDTPGINAGRGSARTRAGHVEMDAAVMRGDTLEIGSVANVRQVRNPVVLARYVMERSPHAVLVGEGAEQAAAEWGLETRPVSYFVSADDALSAAGDTVGAIARDREGRLAVATSTGGTPQKWSGRVGDTPLPGCGFYAHDAVGAVVCSGWGEAILRVVLAYRAVVRLQDGVHPQDAAQQVLKELVDHSGGRAGLLVLSSRGATGCAFNTDHFPRALWCASWPRPRVWLAHQPVAVEDLDHD